MVLENLMNNLTEKAYAIQSTIDGEGEYRFLRTECGNTWYSINPDPMRRQNCICPKCGKTIQVIIPF